jgi:hypothetical protein
MDPLQASSTGFALATAGSLVCGKKKYIKKQRDKGGVGLRWLPFGQKSNNQQKFGGKDRRDDGEGARLKQSVWGGECLFVQGS